MPHTPDPAPLLTLDDVTLRVGDRLFFAHTHWEILTGQHWAILGPNGAGKSILAEALRRQVTVVQGRLLYHFDVGPDGRTTARTYLKRGEIVAISSNAQRDLLRADSGYHQARWQSFEGRDAPTVANLLTGASIEHVSPYEISPLQTDESVYRQRRDQAVALLDIAHLLDRKILHISHGEGRKVLLARALMQRPRALILDDPFCGLDTASREHLRAIMHDIIALNACQVVVVASRSDHIPDNITHFAHVANHRITATYSRAELTPRPPLLEKEGVQRRSGKAAVLPLSSQEKGPGGELAPFPIPLSSQERGPGGEFAAPLIDMRNISVSYGDVPVLQNLTWCVRAGEQWAIVGENGAGKTTLLSLILADNPRAYANDITLFGRRRGSGESIWDIKRHIGWVSPELHLYHQPTTCCAAVVASGFFDSVGLYRQASVEQIARAQAWLDAFDLAHLAGQAFGVVSTGEQRLVLLARALVKSPDLLVLDEPCQGLDDHHRAQILRILDRLCAQTAVHLLYVTHYWREMPTAITHVLHLAHGRIRRIFSGKENFL